MGTTQRRYVDAVDAAAYTVPTDAPEADGTLAWDSTTLVVVRARSGGTTGTGWTYGPAACAGLVREVLARVVAGRDVHAVGGCWEAMVRAARNGTRAGALGYALSAVDVALWDLKARVLGMPLVDLFGAVHERVPVYGSGGFTSYTAQQTADQLRHWVERQRIPRVKIKIGESWGSRIDRDVRRIRLARDTIGAEPELYVDANGAYTAKQAVRLLREVSGQRVSWLEEPVSSDDLAGLAEVRACVDADVAAGEYGTDVTYFRRMCQAGAVDCLQVDATRAGGYTAWFQAAAVAAAHGLEVSAHCAPNLHAPAGAATANLRHLEWFHDHVRIESTLFSGALDPAGGTVTPDRSAVGHGMVLDEDAAAPYAVDRPRATAQAQPAAEGPQDGAC